MILINFIAIISATLNLQVTANEKAAEKVPSIVDGRAVDVSSIPHQVSLEKYYYFHCGGSLISNYHILTAAHCLSHVTNRDSVSDSEMRVRAGTSQAGVGGIIMLVQLVRVHSEYNSETLFNDIGIIKLIDPATISRILKPIALTADWPQEGDYCIASGYGSQEGSHSYYPRNTLEMTGLQIFGKDECYNNFGVSMSLSKICAGSKSDKQGTCFGDSGGPLTIRGKLAGVVSAVFGCGLHATPGIYMSVRYYYDWINTCVRKTSYGPYSC